MKLIISAVVGPMPVKITDPLPKVAVKYDDGTEEVLFDFFPDEVQYSESDFVGKTREQAFDVSWGRIRSEWA